MKEFSELWEDDNYVHIVVYDDFEKINVNVPVSEFTAYTKEMMEV